MRDAAPAGGITWALRLLTVAVIAVPVVLLATAACVNYVAAFREARERVDRAKDAIHEYALKAFESDELILDRIAEHVAGKNRAELIGSEDFHRYLRQFEGKPQISAVGLIKGVADLWSFGCGAHGYPRLAKSLSGSRQAVSTRSTCV